MLFVIISFCIWVTFPWCLLSTIFDYLLEKFFKNKVNWGKLMHRALIFRKRTLIWDTLKRNNGHLWDGGSNLE